MAGIVSVPGIGLVARLLRTFCVKAIANAACNACPISSHYKFNPVLLDLLGVSAGQMIDKYLNKMYRSNPVLFTPKAPVCDLTFLLFPTKTGWTGDEEDTKSNAHFSPTERSFICPAAIPSKSPTGPFGVNNTGFDL